MSRYIDQKAAQEIICNWCGICENPSLEKMMSCDDICPEFAKIHSIECSDDTPGRYIEHHVIADGYEKIYYQHICCADLYECPYRYCPNCGKRMYGDGNV